LNLAKASPSSILLFRELCGILFFFFLDHYPSFFLLKQFLSFSHTMDKRLKSTKPETSKKTSQQQQQTQPSTLPQDQQ